MVSNTLSLTISDTLPIGVSDPPRVNCSVDFRQERFGNFHLECNFKALASADATERVPPESRGLPPPYDETWPMEALRMRGLYTNSSGLYKKWHGKYDILTSQFLAKQRLMHEEKDDEWS